MSRGLGDVYKRQILTCGICGVTGVIIYGIMIFVTGEDDIKSIIKKKG